MPHPVERCAERYYLACQGHVGIEAAAIEGPPRQLQYLHREYFQVSITTDPAFGAPETVLEPALDNYAEMAPHADAQRQAALDALANWTRKTFARLEPTFAARHRAG